MIHHFASCELMFPRTLEEQHEFLHEIVETFDAALVEGEPFNPGALSSQERSTAPGVSPSASPESPARPDWDQPMLFERAA